MDNNQQHSSAGVTSHQSETVLNAKQKKISDYDPVQGAKNFTLLEEERDKGARWVIFTCPRDQKAWSYDLTKDRDDNTMDCPRCSSQGHIWEGSYGRY